MHFYERNITEIKNEYTIFLCNILTPLLYEGIYNLYEKAKEYELKYKQLEHLQNVENPGTLKLFQKFLKNLPKLNNHLIEEETNRIRDNSKCADIFDDLIKAVVKSNIVLLTYNSNEKKCEIVNSRYHETISINEFIHKCYIECAKTFYNYPELFWHEYSTLDVKRNQMEAKKEIINCIHESIRKTLPIKLILQEYLKNDYILDNDDEIADGINKSQYINIKNLLKKDLFETQEQKILESDENENDFQELLNSHDSDKNNLDNNIDGEVNEVEIENIKSISNELENTSSKIKNINNDEIIEELEKKIENITPNVKNIEVDMPKNSNSSKIFREALDNFKENEKKNKIEINRSEIDVGTDILNKSPNSDNIENLIEN